MRQARKTIRQLGVSDHDSRHVAVPRRASVLILALILICAGVAVYSNSFRGGFVYDDVRHIVNDERIRQLWPPSQWWPHRRPMVVVSLAINYALGGLNPWGYHLFNLIVHLLAGLTLFGLVRRTLELSPEVQQPAHRKHDRKPSPAPGREMRSAAFAIALLWVIHPLQTQSVTYVIQRGESLMGLFYLLTLYCTVRGATATPRSAAWYAAAVLSCAFGMGAKAVMMTAPIMALIYDRVFLAGSFRTAIRKRWPLYSGLAVTWGILVLTGVVRGTIAPQRAGAVMGFGFSGASPWTYLLTQAEVIPHYLRLVFWPDPLCLDYGWPFAKSLSDVAIPGTLVAALLILTAWALIRQPRLGFLGVWFFLILGPTSTIVPIQDPAYEHRMYLPLAGIIVLVVVGLRRLLLWYFAGDGQSTNPNDLHKSAQFRVSLVATLLLGATAAALGLTTFHRNRTYASDLEMWTDVISTRPDNARAHYNLGNAYRERGDLASAQSAYEAAVRLSPGMTMAQNNLGNVLRLLGRSDDAVVHLRKATESDPDFAEAYVNLAAALADLGRRDAAIEAGLRACVLDPTSAEAHYNLGMSLGASGRFEEAVNAIQTSIRLMELDRRDDLVLGQAHYYLGITLAKIGRRDEADAALRRAIALDPTNERARTSLGE